MRVWRILLFVAAAAFAGTLHQMLEQAQAMVDTGMLAAGYEYFVLDDGYQNARRDYRGRLQGHALRFRNGIPSLVEQVRLDAALTNFYHTITQRRELSAHFDSPQQMDRWCRLSKMIASKA